MGVVETDTDKQAINHLIDSPVQTHSIRYLGGRWGVSVWGQRLKSESKSQKNKKSNVNENSTVKWYKENV